VSARPHIALIAVVLTSAGCPELPAASSFGVGCTSSSDCADAALMCRSDPVDQSRRCLPPRLAAEPGESCEAPLSIARVSAPEDPVLLDETVSFGAAVDDTDVACGPVGAPDLTLRFTVTARAGDAPDTPQGIAIEAPADVAVEVRTIGCDGVAVRSGCAAPGQTSFIAELPPGDYDLVIDGTPADIGTVLEGGSRIRVSRIDCPTGALPYDAQRCLRSTPLTPMLAPRVEHTAHILDDGGIVVTGGNNGLEGLGNIEVFDPTLARWQYGDLARRRQGHASVVIDDDLIAIGGVDDAGSKNFSQVSFRRLGLPEEHVRFVSKSTTGIDRVDDPTRALAALGEGARMLVISSSFEETGVYPLNERTPRACISDLQCGEGERCLADVDGDGTCVCLIGDCDAERSLRRQLIPDGRLIYADGAALQMVGGRIALVAGLEELALGIIDFRSDNVVVNDLGQPPRRFAAIIPIDGRRAWIVGGEDAEGKALASVVEVDFALGSATPLPDVVLPRPVARPRGALVGDAIIIVDDTDEPVIIDLEGRARQSPLLPARRGSRLIADDNRIILIGGADEEAPTRTVQALELVPRRAPPAPEPTPCVATTLPEDGVIAGNTAIEDDSFQTARCQVPFLTSWSRDQAYTFSVDEPTSVRVINVEIADDAPAGAGFAFRLIRGDCRAYEEVACGDSGDLSLAMFVPEIPPGDYTLIIEYVGFTSIFDDDAPYGGGGYEARVLLGPPLECPADERDPADDSPDGAVSLLADDDLLLLTGRLCPDDVDHVVVEHHGGSSDLSVADYPGVVQIQRAVLDTAATIATGQPVVATTTGGPLADLFDAPAGHYLVTLAAEDDAIDFVQWRLFYEPGCVTDVGDSLIEALDNRTPARAPTLSPGQSLERLLCSSSDIDVVILQPGSGADSFVTVDDTVDVAVFAIDGDVLGDPVPFTASPTGFNDVRLDLGLLDGPVALRLSVPDGGPDLADLDVTVDFAQRQVGDSCTNTLPLVEGGARNGALFVDATAFNDDHNAIELGDCTGFRSPGKDVVFAVELQPGETLNASILGRNDTDVNVYLLDRCPAPDDLDLDVCVVGDDEAGRGGADDITFTHSGAAAATYFLVLDSFFGEDWTGDLGWSIVGP